MKSVLKIFFLFLAVIVGLSVPCEALSILSDKRLLDDWLFQAQGRPTPNRIQREIEAAEELIGRMSGRYDKVNLKTFSEELARLKQRVSKLSEGTSQARITQTYLAVRRIKRRIIFKNPAIDFSQILFIDQPYPRHPKNRPWPYDKKAGQICSHENSHRNGMMAVPGGSLGILKNLSPSGKVVSIGPAAEGSYWRPDLSFDADKVVFCFKPAQDKTFHLYEVNVDGKDLRQLTTGDYDDLDPIYLPDGHIMFVTTRCNTYVRCMPHANSYVLARCDPDGRNIYLVSHGNECDWLPALLDDGRVVYSRWEYTDKPLWRIQSLWTTNPDGIGTTVLWGNQSVWPDHPAEPRQIPGTKRLMFTAVGHHNWFAGSIGIVDPRAGREFPDGLTKVTTDLSWPESGDGPVDIAERVDYIPPGPYDAYKTPFPLNDELFLVSARRSEGDTFRLYLMDIRGNSELLYEGRHNIWHAIPVRPRKRPPQRPDLVDWPGTDRDRKPNQPGVFYSPNVYEGVLELSPGSVKYLRVFQQEYTTFSDGTQTFRWSGPGISIVQEDAVKRILGTVPVNKDGSVYFKAPSGKMLYFQLLDEYYRALQTMRSFTGLMPGERRGCIGCHEQRTNAPPNRRSEALASAPAEITPPPWGDESIGYERFVQPVLDRYCGRCHQGDGEARHVLDLTLRDGYRFMKEPYLTVVGPAIWKNPKLPDLVRPETDSPGFGFAGIYPVEAFDNASVVETFKWYNSPKVKVVSLVEKYTTKRPMTGLSYASPLIARAISGDHHDVKVAPADLRRLIAWVDAIGPYRGIEEIRALPDPEFEGIGNLAIRPRTKTAPEIQRP
jgi:hypothetical protein